MEEAIGRSLTADEVVHHLDGSKDNNDLANLFVVTRRQHPQLHAKQTRYCRAGHPPISDEQHAAEPFLSWWFEQHIWTCEAPGATPSGDADQ
jgi:hypothetical protein